MDPTNALAVTRETPTDHDAPRSELLGVMDSVERVVNKHEHDREHDFIAAFAAWVARAPDRIAVEFLGTRLSYGELDALANRLAHRLLALGVHRDARVGISLPRGPAELVAMLATAKAGAAYVPMVPSNPLERLLAIRDDADPEVVILGSNTPLFAARTDRTIVLDELATATEGYPATAPAIEPEPEQLAYVMFTSGSTGRPKGVEVTRGALFNFLRSMAHTPGLGLGERLLAITTTGFDISGLELYLPLMVGATVVLADFETAKDPRLLRRRLEHGDIDVLQATPATWRLLLEAGWRGDGRLRMLCGGEAMSPHLAQALLAAGGELWNLYGPTETTIWSSLERIEPGFERITVGLPIDATYFVILDEHARPAAPGAEGEIAIGGDGLARGYHRRPELTAERFIAMPDGRRIYRTGDLGRALEDGRVQWLGRLDHQVKLRGFRVELGEIEAVLRAVEGVAEVLVAAIPREQSDARLVAYWVGTAERGELVAAARRRLPDYMVPAAYVRLDAFPLNTNGKIDRKQLPRPELADEAIEHAERPRNDIETRIAAIWRDVLGLPVVPRDSDFFTIGGTSMLATQVITRLERELGLEIPLASFYRTPTVQGLAVNLGMDGASDQPVAVWLRRGPVDQAPLFCLFGIHVYQDLALALAGDRPVMGMHVPFRYVPGRGTRPTLQEIARRYVEVIRGHQPHGPYDLLGLCFGGIVAYEVARLLEAEGERVETVAIVDAILPNGIVIDRRLRLRAYVHIARAVLRQSPAATRWLRKRSRVLLARVPLLGVLKAAVQRAGDAKAIDLPIDGPEVEAEVRRFASGTSRLSARLLVVRAAAERMSPWMSVDATGGWGARAHEVRVHDIEADHLGVLREPHVRSLARALEALRR